ncbi:MAG: hypothetical protein KME49_25350 [Brasilonema octagenarum HA4186-MV1]|nr:hypothetical protein [Brasilonema octagenarum HA4186-MV1]
MDNLRYTAIHQKLLTDFSSGGKSAHSLAGVFGEVCDTLCVKPEAYRFSLVYLGYTTIHQKLLTGFSSGGKSAYKRSLSTDELG